MGFSLFERDILGGCNIVKPLEVMVVGADKLVRGRDIKYRWHEGKAHVQPGQSSRLFSKHAPRLERVLR